MQEKNTLMQKETSDMA